MLPEPRRVGTAIGAVLPDAGSDLGVGEGAQVAVGSLDQYAGALAAGNIAAGRTSATIGTVLAVVTTVAEPPPWHLGDFCLGPHALDGPYFQMRFCSIAANVLEWYRDAHCPEASFGELDVLAAGAPPGAAGLVAEAAPDTPDGSCTFRGERPEHRVGHFVRSIMEAVACALRERVGATSGTGEPLVCLGGGARSDLWLQILADVLGAPVQRLACDEPALLGAAMAAAVGTGHLPDWPAAVERWRRLAQTFVPSDDAAWYRSHGPAGGTTR